MALYLRMLQAERHPASSHSREGGRYLLNMATHTINSTTGTNMLFCFFFILASTVPLTILSACHNHDQSFAIHDEERTIFYKNIVIACNPEFCQLLPATHCELQFSVDVLVCVGAAMLFRDLLIESEAAFPLPDGSALHLRGVVGGCVWGGTDCLILLYSRQSMRSLQSDGKRLHPK